MAPDEGDKHVATFSVPDVHLTGFPDGRFRVSVELAGNWSESRLQMMLGYKRIEPAYYVTLTKEQHLVSLDFEVVQEPWRFWRCEQKAGRSSAVEAGEPKESEGRWWAGTGLNRRHQDFQFSTSTGRIAHLLS